MTPKQWVVLDLAVPRNGLEPPRVVGQRPLQAVLALDRYLLVLSRIVFTCCFASFDTLLRSAGTSFDAFVVRSDAAVIRRPLWLLGMCGLLTSPSSGRHFK